MYRNPMRIVNRKEFLKMPAGTVFSKYVPCAFDGLQIKVSEPGDYGNADFDFDELIGALECVVGDEYGDNCEEMEKGASLPVDFEYTGRDGLFEDEQLFGIYEREDVEKLISRLIKTL